MNDIETKMIIKKSQTQNWLFEKIYKHVAKAIEKKAREEKNGIRKEEKL